MTIESPTTIQILFHKFTLTLFLQVLKFLSFNGINYKSHAEVLCTFKLNSQCLDSVPLMAFETKVKVTFENDGRYSTN